ncbi:HesB/IscA family protein [Halalkalibacter hemicellulosilyticus]|uniref:Probable iron binding protein from the HesB_IscA_SufA family n=1 Tax=Halalkalibacter hemicellulosilyticusJCM 9152 TaxID=1236971 RepID=W4QE32_9BACI|nr:iron-sulfur cluster assembly accessory protein [Halalkalibacter hemicellulosilyticus]GAE30316.1 probable iron binding protein from the HesB_IscA_SufA family [Halalkalibacter hemicellulosilyticusJCM 9152]
MIKITESAVSQILSMKEAEGDDTLMLRFGVKGGGCSGLSYGMGFDNQKTEDDEQFHIDGLDVLIDKDSIPIVKDVVVDYKQNMMGGGFTIDNPNAIANCGCGSSFRTATNAGTPEEC